MRLPLDTASCVGAVLDFGEDRESTRPAEPESVLRVIPDGQGVVRYVLIDTEERAGGVFGATLCCPPLDLGFNKSSRIEVSPIRSLRKEL